MTTHEKHAVVVHLEPLRMRVQEHAQSLARAIFAKSCVRKVAKRGADTLATQPTADPEVKRRCKVLLPSHTRPTHHERALLVNLGVRQDELTILHRRAVRAASMHRRGLQHLLVIAHAQEDRVRRTHEAVGRKRYAPNLVAAHPRRVHLGDIETAQRLAEGTEATPENTHNRPAGDQTAARAQRKHLLALVVRKAHRAAAILLTIERHLHTQVRRRCLLGGRASQVAVAAQHSTHDTIRPRTKLATVVRARQECGPLHHHKRLARQDRPARRRKSFDLRLWIVREELRVRRVVRCIHGDLERMQAKRMRRRDARQQLVVQERRIHFCTAEAAQVRQPALEARAEDANARVATNWPARGAESRHACRRVVCVLHVASSELLPVQRQLDLHRLVLKRTICTRQGVATDLDVSQQMHIH